MKPVIVILLLFIASQASLREQLKPAVHVLAPVIEGFHQSVSAIPVDGRMGLSLEEIYRELFLSFKEDGYRVNRDMRDHSSLRITGAFFFDQNTRQLFVELYLFNGTVQYCSTGKIEISASDAVLGYSMIFNGGVEEQQLLYRAYLGDRLKGVFTGNEFPELLMKARSFSVESYNNELSWKQQIVLDRLQAILGIRFVENGEGVVRFDRNGSLVVGLHGKTNRIHALLPSKPRTEPVSTQGYLSSGGATGFERVIPSLPVEMTILDQIKTFFNREYPRFFSNFDSERLYTLFPGIADTTIMTGSILYNSAGAPTVKYRWITPQRWISGLERMTKFGRTFRVSTEVVEIIQDPHAEFRFWVVVRQNWKTLDELGRIRYEDSGILLINSDFTPLGEMLSVKVHYRLWFFDYGSLGDSRYGMSLVNRLKTDVDQGVGRIKGVDSSLKAVVKEAIFHTVSSK